MPICPKCGCYVENDESERETPLMRALREYIKKVESEKSMEAE